MASKDFRESTRSSRSSELRGALWTRRRSAFSITSTALPSIVQIEIESEVIHRLGIRPMSLKECRRSTAEGKKKVFDFQKSSVVSR
jgi:hypothetical protein